MLLTEGHHIKDLDGLVCTRSCKASPICADADTLDLPNVCSEFLDELDPHSDLLPELHHSIYRARDEEVRVRRDSDERELVFVHQ